jgi:predicted ester cyclase
MTDKTDSAQPTHSMHSMHRADPADVAEANKLIVTRFNREVIEQGDLQAFAELVAGDVVNHAAPPGAPNGAQSMVHFIVDVLRKGFPDIKVEILDQIAEGDRVTTRKVLRGRHSGEFMGMPATGREAAFKVIDIIRLRDGKYAEHWGLSNLTEVVQELRA